MIVIARPAAPGETPPLHRPDALAGVLGIAGVLYKDEGPRFGLGSFRALGGAYAAVRLLARELGQRLGREITPADLRSGALALRRRRSPLPRRPTAITAARSPGGARIGLLKGHETHLRMPLGDDERLIAALPGLGIADATGIVRALRMVKSAAEIEKIARICGVASRTFARVPDFAGAGRPLDDVFRAFRRACLEEGADDVPCLVGGADQGGHHDVISPPDARPPRAVSVSCTTLRVASIAEEAERRIGRPVISANLALAWQMMRAAGLRSDPAPRIALFSPE